MHAHANLSLSFWVLIIQNIQSYGIAFAELGVVQEQGSKNDTFGSIVSLGMNACWEMN